MSYFLNAAKKFINLASDMTDIVKLDKNVKLYQTIRKVNNKQINFIYLNCKTYNGFYY